MQFVQIDESGRPEALDGEPEQIGEALGVPWESLRVRARRLLAIRSAGKNSGPPRSSEGPLYR